MDHVTPGTVDNLVISSCKLFLFLLISASVNQSVDVSGIDRFSIIILCNRVSTYCSTNSPQSELFSCNGTFNLLEERTLKVEKSFSAISLCLCFHSAVRYFLILAVVTVRGRPPNESSISIHGLRDLLIMLLLSW